MILKKCIDAWLAIFFVVTITFFMSHAVPGNPLAEEQPLPQEIQRKVEAFYGLDQPLLIQYGHYLWQVLHGNLGPSLVYQNLTVEELIASTFPFSLALGSVAFFFSLAIASLCASVAIVYRGSPLESAVLVCTILCISTPNFVMAAFLQYVFAMRLAVLPVGQLEGFSYWILPVLALSMSPIAFLTKQLHQNMRRIVDSDFILQARLKGLSASSIYFRHMLPNAMLPLLSYCGQLSTTIVTGSFIIEKVFALPGLGYWLVASVFSKDYPVILGLALFYSSILLLTNLLFDLLHTLLDPRKRREAVAV